jgi:glycosyltransferase involved in cell wall biosynthesis
LCFIKNPSPLKIKLMIKYIDTTINSLSPFNESYLLSIVIPVYNESQNIEIVLHDWDKELKRMQIDYCFIIVNDGSKDNSIEVIKSLGYNIFLLNKHNSGHGRSIRLGYDFAVNHIKSDFILQIDSDGQCDPKYFHLFWADRFKYDFVLGVRTTRGDGIIRKLTSKISLFITSLISSINLKDPNTPYRLFKINTLSEALNLINESFDVHNIAITYVILKKKFSYMTVEISFPNRIGGENSINLLKVFQMGLNMIFDLYFLKKKLK